MEHAHLALAPKEATDELMLAARSEFLGALARMALACTVEKV